MLEHTFARTRVIDRLRHGPLGAQLDDLATSLSQEGYAPSSIQLYLRTAEHFSRWLQGQGYAISEVDEDLAQRYISGLTRYRSGKLPKAAQGLGHLVTFLQQGLNLGFVSRGAAWGKDVVSLGFSRRIFA